MHLKFAVGEQAALLDSLSDHYELYIGLVHCNRRQTSFCENHNHDRMKKYVLAFSFSGLATLALAQPARVPVNEPNTSSGNTTQPTNQQTTTNPNPQNQTYANLTNAELTKYSDGQGRFSISYPTNWTLNKNPENAVIQITSPKEKDEDDFRQNINLQIEDMNNRSQTIEQYVKTNMDAVKDLIKGYREVSSMYFNRNGGRVYEVVYKGKYGDIDYEIQIKQLFVISNGRAFILTYVSKEDERDVFETTANKIFNTFKY